MRVNPEGLRDRVDEILIAMVDVGSEVDDVSLVELGVSSLTVVRLRAAIAETLEVDIDLVDLMGDCTPARVLELVATGRSAFIDDKETRSSAIRIHCHLGTDPEEVRTWLLEQGVDDVWVSDFGSVPRAGVAERADQLWEKAAAGDVVIPGRSSAWVVIGPRGVEIVIAASAFSVDHLLALVDDGSSRAPSTPTPLWEAFLEACAAREVAADQVLAALAIVTLTHAGKGLPSGAEPSLSFPTALASPVACARTLDVRARTGLARWGTLVDAADPTTPGDGVQVIVSADMVVDIRCAGKSEPHLSGRLREAITALSENAQAWQSLDFGWDPMWPPPPPREPQTQRRLGEDLTRWLAARSTEAAVIDGNDIVSWATLAELVDDVAADLPQDAECVGIAMGPSLIRLVWVIALATKGVTYVPLDPEWPESRRRLAMSDAGCDYLLTVQGLARTGVSVPADARGAAYIIFTSGSTGKPKGVCMDGPAVLTTIDAVTRSYGVGRRDRVLGLSALSFDLSVYDVFGVLAAGGCIVLPPGEGGMKDPGSWLRSAAAHHVTVWNTAPALAAMLLEEAQRDPRSASRALRALRLVLLSGDWIPVDLPARLHELAPQAEIVALGGATECGIWSNHHRVDVVGDTQRSIPYGRPLPDQSFHVLDDDLVPVPTGVPGELFIGGTALARGYVGRPDLTDERFIDHPQTGQRVYRTGDRAQWMTNGELEFLGRIDRQVQVRGNRVELAEVELALREVEGVHTCAAATVGERGMLRLVAFVVANHSEGVDRLSSRATRHLRDRLPTSMLPERVVVVPDLPLTPNGKVDYERLASADRTSS